MDLHDFADVTIPFPVGIVVNCFTIRLLESTLKNYSEITLTSEQINTFFNELKKAKRTFKNLLLVDVKSSGGQKVTITL